MAPDERCLYALIGVERRASKAEIRKACHRLALLSHPDKHPHDPTATDRFRSLQRIKVRTRARARRTTSRPRRRAPRARGCALRRCAAT